VIFSLASFTHTITRQDVPTADGHPHTVVTLCNKSYKLFETLRANKNTLYFAVDDLTRMAKSKDTPADTVTPDNAAAEDFGDDL
jgi:hypothetical protein